MKIPKSIRIGGFTYKVDVIDNLVEDGQECFGTCSVNEQSIKIRDGLPKQMIKCTLIHECLEAINYHYKLNLKHDNIERLDSALLDLLENNKGVF